MSPNSEKGPGRPRLVPTAVPTRAQWSCVWYGPGRSAGMPLSDGDQGRQRALARQPARQIVAISQVADPGSPPRRGARTSVNVGPELLVDLAAEQAKLCPDRGQVRRHRVLIGGSSAIEHEQRDGQALPAQRPGTQFDKGTASSMICSFFRTQGGTEVARQLGARSKSIDLLGRFDLAHTTSRDGQSIQRSKMSSGDGKRHRAGSKGHGGHRQTRPQQRYA